MSPLSISRIVSALVAVVALFGGGALNAFNHGSPVLAALRGVPRTLFDVGDPGRTLRWAQYLAGSDFIGKYRAKALHAELMNRLGKTEMNNFSVIKGPDGRLYRGTLFPIYTKSAETLGKCVALFAETAREKGTQTLYLAAPDQVAKGSAELPEVMPIANYNPAVDALLYTLRERSVPFADSRYRYLSNAFPVDGITARTGPLLTGKGGFELFAYLLDALEKECGVVLDPQRYYRDAAHYTFRTYPHFFMGRYGKETGAAFSGMDDFVSVAPAFETEFAVEGFSTILGAEFKAEGLAEQTLLQPRELLYFENAYRFYPESYYLHTNLTWSRVRNLRNPDGAKVLFIHDFYTAPLASLLAPACGELHTLSFRENQEFNAEEYIRDKGFDCVVISLFPAHILEAGVQTLILEKALEEAELDAAAEEGGFQE